MLLLFVMQARAVLQLKTPDTLYILLFIFPFLTHLYEPRPCSIFYDTLIMNDTKCVLTNIPNYSFCMWNKYGILYCVRIGIIKYTHINCANRRIRGDLRSDSTHLPNTLSILSSFQLCKCGFHSRSKKTRSPSFCYRAMFTTYIHGQVHKRNFLHCKYVRLMTRSWLKWHFIHL